MKSTIITHSIILTLSLVFAFYASIPNFNIESEEHYILDVDPKEISSLSLSHKGIHTKMEKDANNHFWISIENENKGEEGGTPYEYGNKTRYKANPQIHTLLKNFSPLLTPKIIGTADEAKLKEYGFKDHEYFINVKTRNAEHKILLGNETFGDKSYYALSPHDQKIFVLPWTMMDNIRVAGFRLMETNLLGLSNSDFATAKIKHKGKTMNLNFTLDKDKINGTWSSSNNQIKTNKRISVWMNTARSSLVHYYPNEETNQILSRTPEILSINFTAKDGRENMISFKKLERKRINKRDGESEIIETFFAYSSFIGTYVALRSGMKNVISEFNDLIVLSANTP